MRDGDIDDDGEAAIAFECSPAKYASGNFRRLATRQILLLMLQD